MKLKALFASFVMIFSVSFVSCSKKSSSNHDKQGLNFVLQQDNTYAVSAGTSSSLSSIVIPERFNNLPVTKIAENGFYRHQAKTITITNGIKSIGDRAFSGCTSLTSINIPDSITSIGSNAFSNCPSLQYNEYDNAYYLGNDTNPCVYLAKAKSENIASCQINENSRVIGDSAFLFCRFITSINIPNGVTSIGSNAFYNCTSITSIVLPNGVISIGFNAFYCCDSLQYNEYDNANYLGNDTNPYVYLAKVKSKYITSCQINESSHFIGDSAFSDCASLTSIVFPNSIASIAPYAFYNCASLTSIVIPNGVTSIGYGAFYSCTSLTSINIPDSIASIGSGAFSGCDSLQYNEYDNAYYLGNDTNPYVYLAKAKSENIASCQINENSHFIGDRAFSGRTSLTSINIPDSVISIGYGVFSNCTSLTSINIPDSVTYIESCAFEDCASLTSIILPNSVASIAPFAFSDCTSLTSINIPDSFTFIESSAFEDCTSLTSIVIPNSVTFIAPHAFANCYSLESVYYTGTALSWGNIEIYYDNDDLTNTSRYYYSETRPTDMTYKYWRYVDGVPTPWEN